MNEHRYDDHDINQAVADCNEIELRLRKSEKRYRDLLEHLPVGVYRTTPEGRFIEANRMLAELLGFENHTDLFRHRVQDFYVNPRDRARHVHQLDQTAVLSAEFRLRRRDGRIVHVRDFPRAVRENGKVLFYTGILVDITDQKKAELKLRRVHRELEKSNSAREEIIQRLEAMSLMDDLTGLFNRRGFFAAAKEHISRSLRRKHKVFMIFLDLDNLKAINDSWGHQQGDLALSRFAGIVKKSLRKSDIKGRLGGDEFAVLACETPRVGVDVLIGRLKDQLNAYNLSRRHEFEISVSLGIAVYDPDDPRSVEELLARADKNMYLEKQQRQKA